MHIQSKVLGFIDYRHMLAQADSLANPAEIHGILSGLVCTGQKLDGQVGFNLILKLFETRAHITPAHRGLIIEMYDTLCRQLNCSESEFELLLPDTIQPLTERAEALSQWCQGFIYSLRLVNTSLENEFSNEVRETLNTICEIAKLDYANIVVRDVDTSAYVGVVEFVRNTVVTLHHELNTPQNNVTTQKDDVYLH